jgi:hypothetical protein
VKSSVLNNRTSVEEIVTEQALGISSFK